MNFIGNEEKIHQIFLLRKFYRWYFKFCSGVNSKIKIRIQICNKKIQKQIHTDNLFSYCKILLLQQSNAHTKEICKNFYTYRYLFNKVLLMKLWIFSFFSHFFPLFSESHWWMFETIKGMEYLINCLIVFDTYIIFWNGQLTALFSIDSNLT